MGKYISILLSSLGMLLLILDSRTALAGAAEGIRLCLTTVIPSLFPFFILSSILTAELWGSRIFRPLGRLCGMPKGGESILAVGLLGGYPVGAVQIANAYNDGSLTRQDANRMLCFCSNAGPAFLFGMVGQQFDDPMVPWLLWGIHILSALAVGIILPGRSERAARFAANERITFATALSAGIRTMATVCGWIILFRLVITFLEHWIGFLLPQWALVLMEGVLELSNGCCSLRLIADQRLRFLVASGLLAFGGLCVAMQTATVTDGLDLRYYLGGKALQTIFSLLLASGNAHFVVIFPIIWLFTKIRGRNSEKVIV